jgi:DNA-binding beta-propeller fold protein YncE
MQIGFRPISKRLGLALCLLVALAGGAWAADNSAHDFFYPSFYVFVPSGTEPSVSVINRTTDRKIGRITLPIVAAQIVVSEAAHLLIAIDGESSRLVLVDLASGTATEIGLAIRPRKLWLSDSGSLLAAVDSAAGKIALVALAEAPGRSHIQSLGQVGGPIRDALFSPDDSQLYVAADGLSGIGVVDAAQEGLVATIPYTGSSEVRFTGLTRSADGAILYAADEGGSPLRLEQPQNWPQGAIDGRGNDSEIRQATYGKYRVHPIDVASDAARIFPTGYGKFLVALNNAGSTVSLVAAGAWNRVAQLHGLADMSTAYSGWFDEVAIVASATKPDLLVIDLDTLTRADEIALPGVPGPGAVTSDGSKLYVPLAKADAIAVVDLRNRRLIAEIPVDAAPSAAVLTRSFDVCH